MAVKGSPIRIIWIRRSPVKDHDETPDGPRPVTVAVPADPQDVVLPEHGAVPVVQPLRERDAEIQAPNRLLKRPARPRRGP